MLGHHASEMVAGLSLGLGRGGVWTGWFGGTGSGCRATSWWAPLDRQCREDVARWRSGVVAGGRRLGRSGLWGAGQAWGSLLGGHASLCPLQSGRGVRLRFGKIPMPAQHHERAQDLPSHGRDRRRLPLAHVHLRVGRHGLSVRHGHLQLPVIRPSGQGPSATRGRRSARTRILRRGSRRRRLG